MWFWLRILRGGFCSTVCRMINFFSWDCTSGAGKAFASLKTITLPFWVQSDYYDGNRLWWIVCIWIVFFLFFFFQATSTVEVDMERAEKLQVTRDDFMGSLNNDIKPVSLISFSIDDPGCGLQFHSSCPPPTGIWYKPGGLLQLHHEWHHQMGRPGYPCPGWWRAARTADQEQRSHTAGRCAAGGSAFDHGPNTVQMSPRWLTGQLLWKKYTQKKNIISHSHTYSMMPTLATFAQWAPYYVKEAWKMVISRVQCLTCQTSPPPRSAPQWKNSFGSQDFGGLAVPLHQDLFSRQDDWTLRDFQVPGHQKG